MAGIAWIPRLAQRDVQLGEEEERLKEVQQEEQPWIPPSPEEWMSQRKQRNIEINAPTETGRQIGEIGASMMMPASYQLSRGQQPAWYDYLFDAATVASLGMVGIGAGGLKASLAAAKSPAEVAKIVNLIKAVRAGETGISAMATVGAGGQTVQNIQEGAPLWQTGLSGAFTGLGALGTVTGIPSTVRTLRQGAKVAGEKVSPLARELAYKDSIAAMEAGDLSEVGAIGKGKGKVPVNAENALITRIEALGERIKKADEAGRDSSALLSEQNKLANELENIQTVKPVKPTEQAVKPIITPDALMVENPDGTKTFSVLRSGESTSDVSRGGTWYENKLFEGQKSSYDITNLRGGVIGVGGKGTSETKVTVSNPYMFKWESLGEGKAVIKLAEAILGKERTAKLSKGIKGINAEKAFAKLENEITNTLSSQGYDSVIFYDKHIENTVLPKQIFKFNTEQAVKPVEAPKAEGLAPTVKETEAVQPAEAVKAKAQAQPKTESALPPVVPPEKPPVSPTAQQAPEEDTVAKFTRWLHDPQREADNIATDLARKQERSQKIQSRQDRYFQLVEEEGVTRQSAMQQATTEKLTGKLQMQGSIETYIEEETNKLLAIIDEKTKGNAWKHLATQDALIDAIKTGRVPATPIVVGGKVLKEYSAKKLLTDVFGEPFVKELGKGKPFRELLEEAMYKKKLPTMAKTDYPFTAKETPPSQQTLGLEIPNEPRGKFNYEPTGNLGLGEGGSPKGSQQGLFGDTGIFPVSRGEYTAINNNPDTRSLARMLLDYRKQNLMSDSEFLDRVKKINWYQTSTDEALSLANELWIAKGRPNVGSPELYKLKVMKTPPKSAKEDRVLKNNWDETLTLEKQNITKEIKDFSKKLPSYGLDAAGLLKANVASSDLSGTLRQGMLHFVRHPFDLPSNVVTQIRSLFSGKFAEQWDTAIRRNPIYSKAISDGYYFASFGKQKGVGLVPREENFMTRWTEIFPWIKGSERAFVNGLNKIRLDQATRNYKLLDILASKGQVVTEIDKKGLAALTNHITGRGSLPQALEKQSALINNLLFSPKYFMSRLQFINDLRSPSALVRKEAAKNMVAFLSWGAGILGAASLAGGKVELDPRSSDFGKIKIGNTRYDIWTGYAQFARFIRQMQSGERKTNEEDIVPQSRWTTLSRFAESKLSPAYGLAIDLLQGQSYTGEKIEATLESAKDVAINTLVPLTIQSIYEAALYENLGIAIPVGTSSALGIGVQTYKPQEPKKALPEKQPYNPYGGSTTTPKKYNPYR